MTDMPTDNASIRDEVVAEVKGPGAEWGEAGQLADSSAEESLPEGVKGPGPQWETNDKGEYINRDS